MNVSKHIHVSTCQLADFPKSPEVPSQKLAIFVHDKNRANAAEIPTGRGIVNCAPPPYSPQGDKFIGTLVTSGYDGRGVSAKTTNFLSHYTNKIFAGCGVTMAGKMFQGQHYFFEIDVAGWAAMCRDFPAFEEQLETYVCEKAAETKPVDIRTYQIDIVVHDQPKVFARATRFCARHEASITSIVGGRYEIPPTAGEPPPPTDLAALKIEITVPAERARQIVRAIRKDMARQIGWFVQIERADKAPSPHQKRSQKASASSSSKQAVVAGDAHQKSRTNQEVGASAHWGP